MPNRYLLDFEEPLRQIRQKIKEIEDWTGHDPEQSKLEIKRLEAQEIRLSKVHLRIFWIIFKAIR